MNSISDNFINTLESLDEDFIKTLSSASVSAKITSGNEQENIIKTLFDNLRLPGIKATCGEPIENTTRKKSSKVDVTIWYNNEPIIAIDVKNGATNGTESAKARSVDVVARVVGSDKKGYLYYVYLHTPQSSSFPLSHVFEAMDTLTDSSTSCKLLTAFMKEDDESLQLICDEIKRVTGHCISPLMIMDEYGKLNVKLSLKSRILNVYNKKRTAAQAYEVKRAAKETKRAALKC